MHHPSSPLGQGGVSRLGAEPPHPRGFLHPRVSDSLLSILVSAERVWFPYLAGQHVDCKLLRTGYGQLHGVVKDIPPHIFLYGLLVGFE